MLKPSEIAHLATFEAAHNAAKTRADWWLNRVLTIGGLQAALAFDRAAEEQQRAAGKLAAARRYLGLKPD